jgi:hypothetical protein
LLVANIATLLQLYILTCGGEEGRGGERRGGERRGGEERASDE